MRDEPLVYTITDGTRSGTIIIKLNGPFTLGNLFKLQAELRGVQPPLTIFDLSDSAYMDSTGLGALINFYVSGEKAGRKMALAGVNQRIEALLEMTHVKDLLKVYPNVEAAEAAL